MSDILLAAINAKWIHPSLALRLLKANLGSLEEHCEIKEFAIRQLLNEKVDPILKAKPKILGLSVSIWNHTATLELLKELFGEWEAGDIERPVIVLGGPEVSYLPPDAVIFRYADYCIRGEGEITFKELCEHILFKANNSGSSSLTAHCSFFNSSFLTHHSSFKTAYHLYTNEDLQKKLTYVEASRGCPYTCEFCLSARTNDGVHVPVREFPLEPFFTEMDDLLKRGAKTIKFLDRSFNTNTGRAVRIMEYFLNKINNITNNDSKRTSYFIVHFEMVPSRFPSVLTETIARFPPGTIRLEIGIQTLNDEVSARIGRTAKPEKELETLRLLRGKTNAIIHADLIAGLPGENIVSFGRGFDALYEALYLNPDNCLLTSAQAEIQLGILKLLPGAAIIRYSDEFGMFYSHSPPYELIESSAIPKDELDRIKNFARFWELLVNRRLVKPDKLFSDENRISDNNSVFTRFMKLSDSLYSRFGRNWGIAKNELLEAII